jgi:hypothetical protein
MSFVCLSCAKKKYKPFFTTRSSYGRCEDCGEVHLCHDVPTAQLERIKRTRKPTEKTDA